MHKTAEDFLCYYRAQAVFFDWDGTLVNSLPFLVKCHNYAHDKLEKARITEQDFEKYFGMPRDELYQDLYGKDAQKGTELFEEYYTQNHLSNINVLSGVDEMLKAFHEKNIAMGVVSNKRGDFLRQEVEYLGWDSFFKSVVGALDTDESKPSAMPLLKGFELAGVDCEKKNILYVGDTTVDLEAAKNAGCPVALLCFDSADAVPHENAFYFENIEQFYKNFILSLAN